MEVVSHLLPDGSDVDSARAALAEHLELKAGRARNTSATFFDTFDGRLYADGLTLRQENGRLALFDRATGDELVGAHSKASRKLFDSDLPAPLRERLASVIEMRALLPVARVHGREQSFSVLNEDAKTVVRLHVEAAAGLHARVRAQGVRGYEQDLERVESVLAERLALEHAGVQLVDEAVVAAGGDPAGTSAKLALTLDPDQPANEAAARVFARLLEVIGENLPGTLDDVDSEFPHDLRVAIRRTRSLQRQFKGIYPERLEHFRAEFKRLQAVTGDLRDLDVYMLDYEDLRASLPARMQPDLAPLRALLESHRTKALSSTRRALRSQRTRDALTQWAEFVESAPKADRSVHDLASHRIRGVYRKMVKMGRAIDDDSPAEDLHELRKVGKELRYLLEFFASLYPEAVVKPFIKTLKGLQDMLGRFQDREVQANALRALAPELKEQTATVMAMGVLVEHFMNEEAAAREEFAARFEAFASAEQRAVVKEHFG
jgi:CHAD domain-containing protein